MEEEFGEKSGCWIWNDDITKIYSLKYRTQMNYTTNKWLALIVLLTAPLLYVIDIFIINIAIPTMKTNLNANDGEIQLIIASYLLGSACFLIIAGRAGDYLGKKKVFFWGMFAFTLTSCLCGFSQTPTQLNVARFFQGVSSAFMVTQSIAFIQILFTDVKERATAIGWYGITLSIAAIIGQILGGYLTESNFDIEGWRLIFFINLPIGLLALWAIFIYLPETERLKRIDFDYSGALLLTFGLGGMIYTLTEGREKGLPWWSYMLFCVSLALLYIFIRIQKLKLTNGRLPLINLDLFKHKEFNIGLFALLFHFMFHTAYLLMVAVYLQEGMGVTALECGMYFIPHALLFMLSSGIAAKLLPRFGKQVLQMGLVIILISFLLQIFYFQNTNNALLSILFIAIYGLGNGFVLPFLLNIVLNVVEVKDAGVASGIFSTFQQTASALGISIIGGIFYFTLETSIETEKYLTALQIGLIASIVCVIIVKIMLNSLPSSIKRKAQNVTSCQNSIRTEK